MVGDPGDARELRLARFRALGGGTFERTWHACRSMTTDAAIALADDVA